MPRKIIGTQKSKKGPLYQPGPLNRDPIQHLYKAQEYTMSNITPQLGKGAQKKTGKSVVFCQTGGRGGLGG